MWFDNAELYSSSNESKICLIELFIINSSKVSSSLIVSVPLPRRLERYFQDKLGHIPFVVLVFPDNLGQFPSFTLQSYMFLFKLCSGNNVIHI